MLVLRITASGSSPWHRRQVADATAEDAEQGDCPKSRLTLGKIKKLRSKPELSKLASALQSVFGDDRTSADGVVDPDANSVECVSSNDRAKWRLRTAVGPKPRS